MVIFKTVRYRNFLSTGNSFTELDINASPTTLVIGKNGCGKSTMLDAICFGLFGKPFRKVNKGQLVNSINKKDCVVEIEFAIGNKQYKVIRGIKPNKFEIWADGLLLNQDAAVKDYQAYLEDVILKLNYKSFNQIVILGTASFIPFMQLPAASRRDLIEDILDIKIFSTMKDISNQRLSALKVKYDTIESELKLSIQKAKIQDNYIKTLKADQSERVRQLESRIADEEQDVPIVEMKLSGVVDEKSLLDDIIKHKTNELKKSIVKEREMLNGALEQERIRVELEIEELEDKLSSTLNEKETIRDTELDELAADLHAIKLAKADCEGERSEHEVNIRQLESEQSSIIKEQKFYEDHDSCEVCKQEIGLSFKKEILSKLKIRAKEIVENIEATQKNILDINARIRELNGQKDSIELKNKEINNNYEIIRKELEQNHKSVCKAVREKSDRIVEELNKKIQVLVESVANMISEFVAEREGELKRLTDEISTLTAEVEVKKKNIKALIKERNSLITSTGNIDEEQEKLKELAQEVGDLNNQKIQLGEEREYLETAVALLKDSGIKTKVIEKYLPSINMLVNKYLMAMDLFVQFELDGEFNEIIKSRYRDEFTYESFSQGQKQRIDLALVLTWRDIAKMKNSTNTNLFILDEVFDSSLDADGTSYLTGLLNTLQGKQNVWVISHKKEEMADKFGRTIQFVERNNFSIMEIL